MVFTAIPFFYYLARYRRAKGFLDYVGLRKPRRRTMLHATLFALAFVLPVLSLLYFLPGARDVVSGPNTVIGGLKAHGLSGAAVALLVCKAFVQTSLSEEILFRGFLAKRLIHRLGFVSGNLLQALLFGLVHLLVFIGQEFSVAVAAGVVLFAALGGWVNGYLNERLGNGSILPSWWLHALTNAITYGVLAFALS
ncbi:hypothetical protein WQ53_06275 [Pseudoxanthomonas suwonensis]|uniref:CAAX prenyl protease 2/Lysostaphin resistance protein A-like domain-containing protein n=1 Tax=Pseudoxanthomonas suwonensis TaxID=314722 RepID=A0A0E3Z2W5_9GAMM|nr:hypothetical protein WQ53_06275 [Pseudoxanthomonas suwonensis]